jgi:hypothetical protein
MKDKIQLTTFLKFYFYYDNFKYDNNPIQKDHFFIEKDGLEVEELIYKKYYDNNYSIKFNMAYKGQLIKAMEDCPQRDISLINNTDFKFKAR